MSPRLYIQHMCKGYKITMASQPAVAVELDGLLVRGTNAYPLDWQSNTHPAQVLRLQMEPQNVHTVSIITADGTTVGHIPFNLSPVFPSLVIRELKIGNVEITRSWSRIGPKSSSYY